MMLGDGVDGGVKMVPSGSSEFQKALQEIYETELSANDSSRVTIKVPRDKVKGHHGEGHHQEERLLQGKEHCYRLHHGHVVPSYSHHRPSIAPLSPSRSPTLSPSISPTRSPVSPRRQPQGQRGSPSPSLRVRELLTEDSGPMVRQRSNSDCVRHPSRTKSHGHPSHGQGNSTPQGGSHPHSPTHLHPHSNHLHVHWTDKGRQTEEARARSVSFGAVDGMRKPCKSILKHPET